jgi:hypothetical protein
MKILETIKNVVVTSFIVAAGTKIMVNILERPSTPQKHTQSESPSPTIEQEVAEVARQSKLKGVPRAVSDSLNLISISSSGRSIYATYEFNAPAVIPITNDLTQEMRNEILVNFKNSSACRDSTLRRLLRNGLTYVQTYNLYNSNQTILQVSISESNCN